MDVPPRPKPTDNEVTWSKYLAATMEPQGNTKIVLPDGRRPDIVQQHQFIAWEVEWCSKWEESIGQSIGYAVGLGQRYRPGVWLLKRGKEDDEEYLQCLTVIKYLQYQGIPIHFKVTNVNKQGD